MLLRAEHELGADLAESWVIGDRVTDVELARRAGCRGAVLVLTGPPDAHADLPPDLRTARDLVDASRLIAG
jgi:D-glycero-D-manno-heptose 1,7-bisphosphate phosphatase